MKPRKRDIRLLRKEKTGENNAQRAYNVEDESLEDLFLALHGRETEETRKAKQGHNESELSGSIVLPDLGDTPVSNACSSRYDQNGSTR